MNTSRLRADIDAGRTGDKTPGEDPTAAPLGTDEEAAGTPIDPALAERVRRVEQRPDGDASSRQNATPRVEDAPASGNRTGGVIAALLWLGAGGAVGLALTVALWALIR
jgi:hypothetical protein